MKKPREIGELGCQPCKQVDAAAIRRAPTALGPGLVHCPGMSAIGSGMAFIGITEGLPGGRWSSSTIISDLGSDYLRHLNRHALAADVRAVIDGHQDLDAPPVKKALAGLPAYQRVGGVVRSTLCLEVGPVEFFDVILNPYEGAEPTVRLCKGCSSAVRNPSLWARLNRRANLEIEKQGLLQFEELQRARHPPGPQDVPPPCRPFRRISSTYLDSEQRRLRRAFETQAGQNILRQTKQRALDVLEKVKRRLRTLRSQPVVQALLTAKKKDRDLKPAAEAIVCDIIKHAKTSTGKASRAVWSEPSQQFYDAIFMTGGRAALAAVAACLPCPDIRRVRRVWSVQHAIRYAIGGKPKDQAFQDMMDDIAKHLKATMPQHLMVRRSRENQRLVDKMVEDHARAKAAGTATTSRVPPAMTEKDTIICPFNLAVDDTALEIRLRFTLRKNQEGEVEGVLEGLLGGPYVIKVTADARRLIVWLVRLIAAKPLVTSLRLYVLTARTATRPRPKLAIYAELHSAETGKAMPLRSAIC